MTALDLITSALRLIGALAASESPTAEESADALTALNELLDNWAAERLTIHTVDEVTVPLAVGQATYTIGPGGQIDRPVRPVFLSAASVLTAQTPPVELPLEGPLTLQQWRQVTLKALPGALPHAVYLDGGIPTRTLALWPVPSQPGLTLKLYLPAPLTQVPTLQTTLVLPTGYARALRFNLALELAPEFGVVAPPGVERLAREALGAIKRANRDDWTLATDPVLSRAAAPYDWRAE